MTMRTGGGEGCRRNSLKCEKLKFFELSYPVERYAKNIIYLFICLVGILSFSLLPIFAVLLIRNTWLFLIPVKVEIHGYERKGNICDVYFVTSLVVHRYAYK